MSLRLSLLVLLWATTLRAADPAPIPVLLLGDKGHHRPEAFAKLIGNALAKVKIDITYTDDVAQLTPQRLAKYEVLAIFRDSGTLPVENEKALLEYVESGKGLVAIHCASHTFRNSAKYTALVGGRFWKHETGDFRSRIIDSQHPAMQGVSSFTSWDETYMHNEVADDIRVLMIRDDKGRGEPYTWVRDQGKGRVFYTALGHDERTWKEAGYHRLLEQGIRWAAGKVPEIPKKPFEYVEANVPFYVPKAKWGTAGENIKKMQKPLSPEESMKHMHTPEGLEVKLFVAEPEIARPLCMTWDDRGRLWIAESIDYPNEMQAPGKGRDRIRICEDTDGDGRADKFTTFADKLSIPTGMCFVPGGLIVTQAPDTLFFPFASGADKPEAKKILFTGWGTRDTHAGPSNLHYGTDGWVWGTVGYSGFDGTVGGKVAKFGQGIWRCKPDGSQIEFLGSTSNNTWGLGFDESGNVFASTANNNHSVHMAIPNRTYEKVRGWYGKGTVAIEDHKQFHPVTGAVRQVDWHGGFTAAAGHAIYTAKLLPEEYQNKVAFVCEPTGHLIHVNQLVKSGSSFTARDGWNLLASTDEWTSPIMAEVGPDGAVWFIDWYNYIIQHNPTPEGFKTGKGNAYETPLRDKTHGRIYRIVPKDKVVKAPADLSKATLPELLLALGSDTLFVRKTAQRSLLEKRPEAAPEELRKLILSGKNPNASVSAIHLLSQWTPKGVAEYPDVQLAALTSKDVSVQRAILSELPATSESQKRMVTAGVLNSTDAFVLQEALLKLADMPGSGEVSTKILELFNRPELASDRWIPQAAIAAAAASGIDFLEAASKFAPKEPAQKAVAEVVRTVSSHLARAATAELAPRLLKCVASASAAVSEPMLEGLVAGWPATGKVNLGADSEKDLGAMLAKLSPNGRTALVGLLTRWGQQDKLGQFAETLRTSLKTRLSDDKLTATDRIAAAKDLLELGSTDAISESIVTQITPQASPELIRGLLDSLGRSNSETVGAALVKRWPEFTPGVRRETLPLLLRRATWTKALLDGIEKGGVERSDLSVEQSQRLTQHPEKAIAERAGKLLASGGKLPDANRQKVIDLLMPIAKKEPGDKLHGQKVFEANCAKCHRHGNLGQSVGPDLTGMAVRERGDLLIEIMDPNRSVEGNYRQYIARTLKGTIVTGLLVAETKTAIEMLDSEAKKQVILREDIEELIASKNSLMPEGFEKLPEADLHALLAFLTARDRYVPLPLGKAATITSVKGMFHDKENDVERLVFPKWGTVNFEGIPFQLIDPRDGSIPNVVLLHGPGSEVTKAMPKSVEMALNAPVKSIHLLSGISGWGFPYGGKGEVSMIVRLHYADKTTEDHELKNGIHFADYIRVVDVPESKLAFKVRGQQVRYLKIDPKTNRKIEKIEFVKGPDKSSPIVVAVTVE